MKYTINGYSQCRCIEFGLDLIDIYILRWLQDFYPKMTKKIFEEKEYVWFSYEAFIQDMPLVKINTVHSLANRLRKIEDMGLIERKCLKGKKGTYSYCRITPKISLLLEHHKEQSPSEDGGKFTTFETTHRPDEDAAQRPDEDDHNNSSTNHDQSTIHDSVNLDKSKFTSSNKKGFNLLNGTNIESYSDKEIKSEPKKTLKGLIVEFTENTELRAALNDFLQHYREKTKVNLSIIQLQKQLDELKKISNNDEAEMINNVNIALCKGWRGFYKQYSGYSGGVSFDNMKNQEKDIVPAEGRKLSDRMY